MNFLLKNNTGNEQKTTSWPRKSLMIMRCIVLFWLLGTLQVMANLSYSQSVRLSFEMKDATVREILSVIEQKSDFYFTYNSTQIEAARKISVKVKNRLITDVLDEMFAGQNVNYTIINPTYKYRNLLLSSYAAYSIDLCLKYFFTLSGVFVRKSICCFTLFCNMSLFLGDFLADSPCFKSQFRYSSGFISGE